jgi:hypothetical protein
VNLDLVASTIKILRQYRDDANDLLIKLADEAARLRSDLPLGPTEALEVLRCHAITCVEHGDNVTYFSKEGSCVEASLCRAHYHPSGDPAGEARCWKAYYSASGGNAWETHLSSEYVINEIATATMFKSNVKQP